MAICSFVALLKSNRCLVKLGSTALLIFANILKNCFFINISLVNGNLFVYTIAKVAKLILEISFAALQDNDDNEVYNIYNKFYKCNHKYNFFCWWNGLNFKLNFEYRFLLMLQPNKTARNNKIKCNIVSKKIECISK